MHFSSPRLLLFLFFILSLSPLLTSPNPEAPTFSPTDLRNETVYNVSKSLCFDCWAESIQFLYYHNLVRLAHLELPLAWDPRLESYARWWAQQRSSDCALRHSFPEGGFTLGENIFWGPGSRWGPRDAVGAWADERRWYMYERNECEPGRTCGHYTQLVWRSTRRVGCARLVCRDGDVFMTCNYDPPGNYAGERPY